jgi:ATP-dependent Clp protease protease subunit
MDAVIYIYEDIGPAWLGMVDAQTVISALADLEEADEVNVRINSLGGDVFEAFAIYNALVRHPARIVADVDGIAASAASVILQAADVRRVAANGQVMIHDAWTVATGTADELRAIAQTLEQTNDLIVDTYAARSHRPREEVREAMRAETWYTPEAALAAGLVDEVSPALKSAAIYVPQGRFRNTPPELLRPQQTQDIRHRARECARRRACQTKAALARFLSREEAARG